MPTYHHLASRALGGEANLLSIAANVEQKKWCDKQFMEAIMWEFDVILDKATPIQELREYLPMGMQAWILSSNCPTNLRCTAASGRLKPTYYISPNKTDIYVDRTTNTCEISMTPQKCLSCLRSKTLCPGQDLIGRRLKMLRTLDNDGSWVSRIFDAQLTSLTLRWQNPPVTPYKDCGRALCDTPMTLPQSTLHALALNAMNTRNQAIRRRDPTPALRALLPRTTRSINTISTKAKAPVSVTTRSASRVSSSSSSITATRPSSSTSGSDATTGTTPPSSQSSSSQRRGVRLSVELTASARSLSASASTTLVDFPPVTPTAATPSSPSAVSSSVSPSSVSSPEADAGSGLRSPSPAIRAAVDALARPHLPPPGPAAPVILPPFIPPAPPANPALIPVVTPNPPVINSAMAALQSHIDSVVKEEVKKYETKYKESEKREKALGMELEAEKKKTKDLQGGLETQRAENESVVKDRETLSRRLKRAENKVSSLEQEVKTLTKRARDVQEVNDRWTKRMRGVLCDGVDIKEEDGLGGQDNYRLMDAVCAMVVKGKTIRRYI